MDLSIGKLSKQVGCKVPTIRYYEQIGLLTLPLRTNGNQRRYTKAHIQELAFIRHARELGFSIDSIKQLIAMNNDHTQKNGVINSHSKESCHLADELASKHLEKIEEKIAQLNLLRDEMKKMLAACESGKSHNCQVMNVLSDHQLCEHEHS